MQSWTSVSVPVLPNAGGQLCLYDSSRDAVCAVTPNADVAQLYVCGVTPYDTTHVGHAATYVTFDVIHRTLLDTGHVVHYVQNVTDVDDPLLERAERDHLDWRQLAQDQLALFSADMQALRVLAPHDYVGVVEAMPDIVQAVQKLRDAGLTYQVQADTYLDLALLPAHIEPFPGSRVEQLQWFAERGGDPQRAGKRDRLDPLLWRSSAPGEPAWQGGVLGAGRPGWHIECTAIALRYLGDQVDIQGGGSDLRFPHHAMTSKQAVALTGHASFAGHCVHQAMVSLAGEKMSKSLGNLVRVRELTDAGTDPMAIRLVLLEQHYRHEWEWTPALVEAATKRLQRWRAAFQRAQAANTQELLGQVRAALRDDLDTPTALRLVDRWCLLEGSDPTAPGQARTLVDALLGVAGHDVVAGDPVALGIAQ